MNTSLQSQLAIATSLMILVLTSGCAGVTPPDASERSAESAELLPRSARLQNATFLGVAGSTFTRFSGEFNLTDSCNVGTCAMGQGAWNRTFDLDPLLPDEAPARVSVALSSNADRGPLGRTLVMTLQSEPGRLYNSTEEWQGTTPAAGQHLNATLVRGTQPTLLTISYHYDWPLPQHDRVQFTLEVHVEAYETQAPGSVPLQIDLAPDDPLYGFQKQGPLTGSLLNLDGTIVTRFTADANGRLLPKESNLIGQHILLVSSETPWFQLARRAPLELKPLSTSTAIIEARPPMGGEPEWRFDTELVPYSVGVLVRSPNGACKPATFGISTMTATITSPQGTVFQGVLSCPNICAEAFGPQIFIGESSQGHDLLSPGTYTVRVEFAAASNMEISSFVRTINA